jgi:hypothetical protein
MQCWEELLGGSQTLLGVLVTLLVLCLFENESNFIIQFAKSIAEGRGFLQIYQIQILNEFAERVDKEIVQLISANARATEINKEAEKLRNVIAEKLLSTKDAIAPYAYLMMKLTQRHVSVILYLFLYAIIILVCDAIPGGITSCSYLFVFCFSLLSIEFFLFFWLHKPSVDDSKVNRSTLSSWILLLEALAFVAGQSLLRHIGNTDILLYLAITFVPLFMIAWSLLNRLKNRIFLNETLSKEFVALGVLVIIFLSIVPAACYLCLFQESQLLLKFVHGSIPSFRIGIIIFILLTGLILPLFTPLLYGYAYYRRRCYKISAKHLRDLQSRLSNLKELYASLP